MATKQILGLFLILQNAVFIISQDICRNYPYRQATNTLYICERFSSSVGDQPQTVELNCIDSQIIVGKIEIGYRDRLCRGIINYVGCCFGELIPNTSAIVCQSQVDLTGTTNRLIEFRRDLIAECAGQTSCGYQILLQPFLEQAFQDTYSVYLQVEYGCSGDSTTKTNITPPPAAKDTAVIGWIVAAVILVVAVITIIAIIYIYRKKSKRNVVVKCVPRASLQSPKTSLGPLPSVPAGRNSSYAALDGPHHYTVPNDYEKLSAEDSDVHDYLEPTAPFEKQPF